MQISVGFFFYFFKIFPGEPQLWYESISAEFPRVIWGKEAFSNHDSVWFHTTRCSTKHTSRAGRRSQKAHMHSLLRLVCPPSPFIQALYPCTSTECRRSQLPTSCRLQQNQDVWSSEVVVGLFRVEVLNAKVKVKPKVSLGQKGLLRPCRKMILKTLSKESWRS